MEKKYFWQSKWIFILAAIGSAAGLGNLWRFPFQVYDH
jgi:NSS family neurotransmitter:Na+ symporter